MVWKFWGRQISFTIPKNKQLFNGSSILSLITIPFTITRRFCKCQPATGRPVTSWVHYTTSCNTQSSVPEDGQNNCPKHVELTGIINKPLLLHLVGCLYYLYQWCTVKQISDNEIYLLIKCIKSVLWRVAKRLSCIQDARCLKVKEIGSGHYIRNTDEQFVCQHDYIWRLCIV